MRCQRTLVVAVLGALLAVAAVPSHAQDPGDAGVFADSLGTQTTLDVVVNQPFFMYVVAFDVPEIFAYEGAIRGLPAGMFPLFIQFMGPAPLFLGSDPLNFIIGTGGCVTRDNRYLLIKGQFLATQPVPSDTAILFTGASPSSFGGLPGYVECDNQTYNVFGVATSGAPTYPDASLILNATMLPGPVEASPASFGSVKARY